jgi:hypothetical protein
MGKSTKQQEKAVASKLKAGQKSQARKANKKGIQSQKRPASDGSDDADASSDPEGPSARPNKKGKHVDTTDKENDEEIEDTAEDVELIDVDQPESEPEPVRSLCH